MKLHLGTVQSLVHRAQEVTEITEDTVTIAPENGGAAELNYNEDTIFILRGTLFLEGRRAGYGYLCGNG